MAADAGTPRRAVPRMLTAGGHRLDRTLVRAQPAIARARSTAGRPPAERVGRPGAGRAVAALLRSPGAAALAWGAP
jgi:hypothetical protein